MREGEEGNLRPSSGNGVDVRGHERNGIRLGDASESRELRSQRLASQRTGGHRGELGVRVQEEQAQQFPAGITTGANDCDFNFLGHES